MMVQKEGQRSSVLKDWKELLCMELGEENGTRYIYYGIGVGKVMGCYFDRLGAPFCVGNWEEISYGCSHKEHIVEEVPPPRYVIHTELKWRLCDLEAQRFYIDQAEGFIIHFQGEDLLNVVFALFMQLEPLAAVSGGNQSEFSKKENANAIFLVASQKTLPVMVAVVEQLGGALGESGLLVLPCVAAHLNQIILDSILVNYWHRKYLLSTNNAKVS
ncbi:hypothetical protein ACLB2K_068666 [Fragaria x ananassa]